MMCLTVLNGGVCHRTSTTHKRGNKMKEKKTAIKVGCVYLMRIVLDDFRKS